ADIDRRNCPCVRGVLSKVPEASMSAAAAPPPVVPCRSPPASACEDAMPTGYPVHRVVSPPGMPLCLRQRHTSARRQLAQREYQERGCGRRKTARDEHGRFLPTRETSIQEKLAPRGSEPSAPRSHRIVL